MYFKKTIEEILTYLRVHIKKISTVVLKKKPKKEASDKEERFDIGIDDIRVAHEKIPKRIGYMAVGLGLLIVLILTTLTWTQQVSDVDETRAEVEDAQLNHEEVDISIDEQGWKHFQSRRIDMVVQSTEESIAGVKDEMKTNSEELSKSIKQDLNETKGFIKGYVEQINESMNTLKEDLSSKLRDTVSEVDEKIKKNEEFVKQNAEKLSTTSNFLNDSVRLLDDSSKLLPPPLESLPREASAKVSKKQVEIEEIIIEPGSQDYIYDDVSIDSMDIKKGEIATSLYSDSLKDEDKNVLYHIMKGLTNATLLTGINAPTFGGSNNQNPAPVLFSVDGDTFIANDETSSIENCLISGSATGNVNTSKADVLLTEISCSGYNKDGEKIKIEQSVKGWVIGEDGSFGLQGRLLDSSGKIITKMIALEIIQALSQSMVVKAMPEGTTTYGGIGSAQNAVPYGSVAQQGLGSGINKGLDHTFEHYSQILSGMYPTISVMAGKKVTLHLKGGESVEPTPYNELDINTKLISKSEVTK